MNTLNIFKYFLQTILWIRFADIINYYVTGAVGPFLMFCLDLSFISCPMQCGSCTGAMCQFSSGVNVVIVANFVGKWRIWWLILSAWHLIRWLPLLLLIPIILWCLPWTYWKLIWFAWHPIRWRSVSLWNL